MKKNRKISFVIIVLGFAVIVSAFLIVVMCDKNPNIKADNAKDLYADEIIKLDKLGIGYDGFTCTGATYDSISNSFYVGDAGKIDSNEDKFHAVIRQVSANFDSQIDVYNCHSLSKNMRDIQGVTLDNNRNIYFCSYGEDLIRCINIEGEYVSSFQIKAPSGIAYSKADNCFWILSDKNLIKTSKAGKILKKYYLRIDGQDQLYYDSEKNELYITAGLDYYGDSFVYVFNIDTEEFELRYILHDSYAIEGISIVDDKMYIFNDGLYHEAKVPDNQVNIYYLNR